MGGSTAAGGGVGGLAGVSLGGVGFTGERRTGALAYHFRNLVCWAGVSGVLTLMPLTPSMRHWFDTISVGSPHSFASAATVTATSGVGGSDDMDVSI